jgi:aspartate aminotransferase
MPSFSKFAADVRTETAFDVLVAAKKLKAAGKDVIELEIGDSPFDTPPHAAEAGIKGIRDNRCRYAPSDGIPEFRQAAAEYIGRELGVKVGPENIVAGPGAKTFQTLFCEAFVNPGDGVLVFSPHFPTYDPNIARRGARVVLSALRQGRDFRPSIADVRRFLTEDPSPKAIILNSPHNPTGGVTTRDDLRELADLIRGKDIVVFSDEPYEQMVWNGRHETLLSQPGMMDQCVAAYTMSKSYSMSGWRIGFTVSNTATATMLAKLTNTALSCVPPFVQLAGAAAMREDNDVRDERMKVFRQNVERLVDGMNRIEGVRCLMPGGTFYVFPSVAAICNRLKITSHGLAMYFLEGADDRLGVACMGGECFGDAGAGFLRLSCAEPAERLDAAIKFLPTAIERTKSIERYLETYPKYRLATPYEPGFSSAAGR